MTTAPQEAPATGRVAILSSASGGGAGIAAKRLCDALNAHGALPADFIEGKTLGEMLPLDVAPQSSFSNHTMTDTHFTVEYPGYSRGWLVGMLRGYDLVNVHWASYLVSLAELYSVAEAGVPMLFTLHDFHYITGGCHYPALCGKLSEGCTACPQVDTTRCSFLQMQTNLSVKREIFAFPNVHLVAPSQFLRDQAVATGIVPEARGHVLRNPYQPVCAATPRAPGRAVKILLIADSLTEGRKKMGLAVESLGAFVRECRHRGLEIDITVDVVGLVDDNQLPHQLDAAHVPYVLHGRISDHEVLSQILRQSDLMLSCSNEDNWPNILVEAGSYGCMPIVGPGHGCEEFVKTYGFGQVARDYNVAAFVEAMIAGVAQRSADLGAQTLAAIRADHDPATIAAAYAALCARIRSGDTPRQGSADLADAPRATA